MARGEWKRAYNHSILRSKGWRDLNLLSILMLLLPIPHSLVVAIVALKITVLHQLWEVAKELTKHLQNINQSL